MNSDQPVSVASDDSLSALFHEIYRPSAIPEACPATLKHWRQALKWFGDALGHSPRLGDLAGDVIERSLAVLLQRGLAISTADVVSMKITALWRFLAQRGVVATWPKFPRARATAAGVQVTEMPRQKPKRARRRDKTRWRVDHPEREELDLRSALRSAPPEPILIPTIFDRITPLRVLVHIYADRKLLAANEQTLKHYETAVRLLDRLLAREAVIGDLTEENVIGVMRLTLRAGCVPQTANCYRGKLVALWNFAAKRRLLEEWPDLKKLTEPRKIPFVWMPGQMELIFESISRQTWHIGTIPASAWFRAFILTMWDTAERLGALLQVRWSDMQGNWLVVPAEFRKWKREDKAHELHADTIAALRVIAMPDRELIFPWPWTRSTLFRRYKSIQKAAGLNPSRKSMFHAVRRTVASHYQQAGGDASDLLGHGDRRTARESYLSPLIVRPPQASELVYRPDGQLLPTRLTAEGGAS